MSKLMMALTAMTCFGIASAQAPQPNYSQDMLTGKTSMTEQQAAQYRAEYQAAKAQWAKMTPQQKSTTLAAAREKKLKDLSTLELVGQKDDMQRETAAQSAADKAQADAAKAKWDKLSTTEKEAVRKSAQQKKRAELDEMELAGQRD